MFKKAPIPEYILNMFIKTSVSEALSNPLATAVGFLRKERTVGEWML